MGFWRALARNAAASRSASTPRRIFGARAIHREAPPIKNPGNFPSSLLPGSVANTIAGRNTFPGFFSSQAVRGFAQEAREGTEAEEEGGAAAATAESEGEADDADEFESDEEDATPVEDKPEDSKETKKMLELIEPKTPAIPVIEKWLKEGNKLTESALLKIHSKINPRTRYKLISWVLRTRPMELTEKILLMAISRARNSRKLNVVRACFTNVPQELKTPVVCSAMVGVFVKLKDIRNADSFLATFTPTSPIPYNSVMELHLKLGETSKATRVFNKMKAAGVKPNKRSLYLLRKYKESHKIELDEAEVREILEEGMDSLENKRKEVFEARDAVLAYSYGGDGDAAGRIWSEIEKLEGELPLTVYLAGMEAFGELGRVEKVEEIFTRVKEQGKHTKVSFYPEFIRACVRNGLMEKAEGVFKEAKEAGKVVNYGIFAEMIEAYVAREEREKALEMLKDARESGLPYEFIKALLPFHAKLRDVEGAEALVNGSKRPNLYAFNKLLKVYVESGKRPPLDFTQRMEKAKVKGNDETRKLLKKTESFTVTEES